ncbi:DNA-3-methyladenine glycosylase [Patescibacteria group bacterium]
MKLKRKFYARPTLIVAQDLLGKILVRRYGNKLIKGRIIETEAYIGKDDPACHACSGMTKRNKPMFGKAGHTYIYFTYGMHYCFNIVTEKKGFGSAVLIRSVKPLTEIDFIRKQRGKVNDKDLTNGPAKLCQAFALDKKLNNENLLGNKLWVEDDGFKVKKKGLATAKAVVKKSPRVGIRDGLDKDWRFYL